jgi:2-methylcitrate dehydratase PrpD
LSAQLVRAGFTGPPDIFDGDRNIFLVCGTNTDADELCAGLGEEYEVCFNTLKPFACAGWRNPIIESAIAMTAQHPLRPEEIDSVAIWAWEGVSGFPNYPKPRIGLEAKFSAQYAAAVGLVDRAGGVAQFCDERVVDPVLAELTGKVTLDFDPSFTHYEIRLLVTLSDGRVLEHFLPVQKGDHANPLTWDELMAKFQANAALALPPENVEPLAAAVREIDAVADVAEITRLCRA